MQRKLSSATTTTTTTTNLYTDREATSIFIPIGKPLQGTKLFRKTLGVVKTVISVVLLTVNKEINNLKNVSNTINN